MGRRRVLVIRPPPPSKCRIKTDRSSTELVAQGLTPAHRRIFLKLREQIRSGKYPPGTRLPGTKTLATQWHASVFTLHTALHALAREGWVDRRSRAGTYVADPRTRFLSAGIYHAIDLSSNRHTPFTRSLHFYLMERLERLKKDVQVFNDFRPVEDQGQVFPPLAGAVLERRIQCLIAPTINLVDAPALAKLSVPTAFFANSMSPNRVNFDMADFFRGSAKYLAAQGCRSVGLVSNLNPVQNEESPYRYFYSHFHEAARTHGLATQENWICAPRDGTPNPDLAAVGYRGFKELWKLRKKPDGVIVYPDAVAHGVIMAILEVGMRVIRPRMKFVFHRNAHLNILCPFSAMWGISDEGLLAEALVRIIQKQFDGEEVFPTSLPFEFREE
jgi:DNA-binding LacI/PurR family transcriptional regulator